jgi:hypothetical protein
MKQRLLFSILFFAISLMSNAQLTVTGTGANNANAIIGFDTSVGQFYTFYPTGALPGGPITNIFPLVKDPGSNLYAINTDLLGYYYQYKFIVRIGNYWYLGYKVFIFPSSNVSLQLRYPVQTNNIDPPCSGLWEERSNNGTSFTGNSTYQMVTIAGATCSTNNPINPSQFTIFSNSVSLPSLNYGQIINIPPPITTGTMVYNTTNNCISIYNGTSWSCLVSASNATYNVISLTTLPFTLTNQHNYVIYTGAAGTLTLPVASTCVGRLYNISNYGTGIITLSQPYTISNTATSTTINQNANIQIIATATGWYKVNYLNNGLNF